MRCSGRTLLLDVEDAWREVHRPGQQAREEQDRLVLRWISTVTTPRIVFLSTRAFAAHHVRVRPTLAGVVDRFVNVDHDSVFRRRLDDLAVVTDGNLRIVRVIPA